MNRRSSFKLLTDVRIIIRLASLEQYDDPNDEERLEKVERYVILIYDRTSDLPCK